MSNDKVVPIWHAIVGEDHGPVQIGEMTKPDEDVLRAEGWVRTNDQGGLPYREDWLPRRRRKPSIELLTKKNGVAYEFMKNVKPGECFMIGKDGELIPIEWPAEKGQR